MVDIRYAKSAGASIAYRVVGEAALDLVYVPDFVSNLVYAWESSYWRGFYERLARSFRLILFDKRGTGLSDGGGHGTRGRFGARRRSWRACAASGSRRGSVEVRVGIHGECERLEGKLGGITVPTGARIGALAGRGEVLVSGTVPRRIACSPRCSSPTSSIPQRARRSSATGAGAR
jgi:hypothetical protein